MGPKKLPGLSRHKTQVCWYPPSIPLTLLRSESEFHTLFQMDVLYPRTWTVIHDTWQTISLSHTTWPSCMRIASLFWLRFKIDHYRKYHSIQQRSLSVTPKICISIVFRFLGAILTPKSNWRQCLRKIFKGWQTKCTMVCYGIFFSGQLPYRKITNKSMEISLTALEIVLLLLSNYFVLKSKDPVFKMGV